MCGVAQRLWMTVKRAVDVRLCGAACVWMDRALTWWLWVVCVCGSHMLGVAYDDQWRLRGESRDSWYVCRVGCLFA